MLLLRRERIRFVEVARRGNLEKAGIVVLSDSRTPTYMHMDGAHKLSDELRTAGTVTQLGGEHRCSLKFKAFVIETWLGERFQRPARHALATAWTSHGALRKANKRWRIEWLLALALRSRAAQILHPATIAPPAPAFTH